MKRILLLTYILFSTHILAQSVVNVKEVKHEVILGIPKVIRLDFNALLRRDDVQPPGIFNFDFVPQKREVVIKPLKPGSASMLIRDKAGNLKLRLLINVTATQKSRILQELQELIGDIEGIKIGLKGQKIFVGGRIIVPEDIAKVVLVLNDYKNEVLNIIEVAPQTYQIIAKKMQEGMRKNNLNDVTVRYFNKSYLLEGVVKNQGESDLANRIAEAHLPDSIESLARRLDVVQKVPRPIIQNFLIWNPEAEPPPPLTKLIKITAQFVELTKDYSRIFGFQWRPLLGGDGGSISFARNGDGGVGTSSSNDTLSGTISNLFPKLQSAKSAGYARIVQSGVVITKDGLSQPVNIKKQSTRNITVGTGETQLPQQITAGFDLKVTPRIIQDEQIDMVIDISVKAEEATGNTENLVSTHVIVKNKESAVIGGISINSSQTKYDKDPIDDGNVEDGSALFNFIRSKNISRTKEQFVVFITPEVISSASDGTESIKRKFRKRGF
ncbi:MAG: hypothetical protein VX341_04245 [Bdellovibrionota bacterium]|nr:hypothetical protein [Bdellovibrionota bacterium]